MVKKDFLAVILVVLAVSSFLQGCSTISTLEKKKVRVGDIEMSYRIVGEGEPLVMIMGYSCPMEFWPSRLIKRLSSDYKIIIFDNRGIGDTTSSPEDFSIEQLADDTAGLLDALGINRAHILGWSLGGYIAQELVLKYPDKVDKLILYATDCGGDISVKPMKEVEILFDTSGSYQERMKRWARLMFPSKWYKTRQEEIEEGFSLLREPASVDNIKRQIKAIKEWKGTCARLSQLEKATLVVVGTEDVLIPPENSRILAKSIPHATLVEVKNCGHGLMYQYPDRFARIVLDFLNTHSEK